MRKLFFRSCLLACLTISLAGQTDNWKRYANPAGNFAVLFPGQPQDSVNGSNDQVQSHTLMASEGSAVYMVVYSAMSSPQSVDDATYEVFKNAVFKELPKCAVESEQQPSPALAGYLGHWYRLGCDMPNARVMVEGNLYWGRSYAYAVMTMYPANVNRPQAGQKFLGSFSVLTGAK